MGGRGAPISVRFVTGVDIGGTRGVDFYDVILPGSELCRGRLLV